MRSSVRESILTVGSVLAVAMPHGALAQTAETPNSERSSVADGNEIIVSARRTDEALQDVPLSISVFTNETLANRSIDSAIDLAKITPNFHFYSSNGRTDTSSLFIRGLNANTTDTRYQNVTFFLDGIPLSGSVMGLPTNNVKQVEIVKGPQSATFGKATYSGAVNYITNNPTPDTIHGSVRGRLMDGSGVSTSYLAAARVEFPIIQDGLWAEVSGSHQRDGALYSDPFSGEKVGLMETTSAGLVLYAEPAEGLSIKLRGQYEYDEDGAPALALQGPREWDQAGVLVELPSGLLWSDKLLNPRNIAGCDAVGYAELDHCGAERKRWFGGLVMNYEMESGWSTSLLAGLGYQRSKTLTDIYYATYDDPLYDDLPYPTKSTGFFSDTGHKTKDWSAQFIVSSPQDMPLRGRAGLGYFYDSITYYNTTSSSAVVNEENPNGKREGKLWGTNAAIFVGADWNIAMPFTLSLEARLERQKIAYDACTVCQYINTDDRSTSETNFLPRATIKYDLTSNNNIYALYSKGTHPARFNDTLPPDFPIATSETLNNFEIGSKNALFGNRLTLNLAAFYQKLTDQQYRTIVPGTSTQTIQNVASSRVWGFEIETVARLTPALTFTGGIGFADHEFTSSVSLNGNGSSTTALFPPGEADVIGLTSYNTPRWNGAASLEYRRYAFGDFNFSGMVDYSFTGKQFGDLANIQVIDAAHIFNLRFALESESVTIAFLVRNLTDDNTPTGANLGSTRSCLYVVPEYPSSSQRCNVAGMRRPREFGVDVGFRF
ncbi:MAG: TonB-dependent receptor [Novosphingobium sp.]